MLSSEQAEALWQAFTTRYSDRPHFSIAHLAYYFGALLVILSMGWFLGLAWQQHGGASIFFISSVYAVYFSSRDTVYGLKNNSIFPRLIIHHAVSMGTSVVYGFQEMMGLWYDGTQSEQLEEYHIWIKSNWFFIDLSTVIVGVITLRFIPFPFLMAPVAFSLWYMSMDLTPLLFGKMNFEWHERLWVSLIFGLLMLIVAYWVDRRTKQDYAFWLYLFGMLAFWGGLSLLESDSESGKFLYFLINRGLMLLSVLLQRKVFIVFGAIGVLGYLGHLAHDLFRDMLLFPIVLTVVGIFVIYLGIQYQRYSPVFEALMKQHLPDEIKRVLPQYRAKF
ncbi:MAG: DUF2157 domain-containing protein [Thiotrichaceae bacterium]